MSRVLLMMSLVVGAVASSGCVATGAICASWLAAPCIICFGDGTEDPNGPYQAMSVEVASTPSMSMSDETPMTY